MSVGPCISATLTKGLRNSNHVMHTSKPAQNFSFILSNQGLSYQRGKTSGTTCPRSLPQGLPLPSKPAKLAKQPQCRHNFRQSNNSSRMFQCILVYSPSNGHTHSKYPPTHMGTDKHIYRCTLEKREKAQSTKCRSRDLPTQHLCGVCGKSCC